MGVFGKTGIKYIERGTGETTITLSQAVDMDKTRLITYSNDTGYSIISGGGADSLVCYATITKQAYGYLSSATQITTVNGAIAYELVEEY